MSSRSQIPQPVPEDVDSYLGRRIVLTCRSELSVCGVARCVVEVSARLGILVETDSQSGLSIWCPLDFIKSVTVIPVPVENPCAGGREMRA